MLDASFTARLDESLAADDASRQRRFPGDPGSRQPVHTVYVPADRFSAGPVGQWREQALAALREYGPMPGVDAALAALVGAKLAADPIEDLCIDAEDGYGTRPDVTEDEHVRAAARALAATLDAGTAPALVGIRMKSLEDTTRRRGLRTLDLFLDTLLSAAPLPPGFRVTLPKVTSVRQVEAMVEICRALESGYALGWDLHPAQLPSRYAATFGFYRDGVADASERLRAYLARAGTRVLDEPATARALAAFLVRGLACGAIGPEEVHAGGGLDRSTLDRLALSA